MPEGSSWKTAANLHEGSVLGLLEKGTDIVGLADVSLPVAIGMTCVPGSPEEA